MDESCASADEDSDPDLRATVAKNRFYQQPEDQILCRPMSEAPIDQIEQVPG